MNRKMMKQKWQLTSLCNGLGFENGNTIDSELYVSAVSCNSKDMVSHSVFVAIKGAKFDGKDYIDSALDAGATVVIAEDYDGVVMRESVTYLVHANPRLVLSQLAAKMYDQQPAFNVAVTGTNGKTSVATFVRQLWGLLHQKAASIGTIGITVGEELINYDDGTLTTPDPVKLHQSIHDLVGDYGVEAMIVEASSHGLHQYRLDGIALKAGVFTNLTQDHLDYHGDFEHYFQAKARLFNEVLPQGAPAIINVDSEYGVRMKEECAKQQLQVIEYGFKAKDIQITAIEPSLTGQKVDVTINGASYHFATSLVGEFQVYNLLASGAVLLAQGIAPATMVELLSKLKSVPGRMQHVVWQGKRVGVFVDYAHTPDALENVLKSLKPCVERKLHVVFGCGGDRDNTKRPLMGAAACNYADYVVVTDDNPRNEDAKQIRDQVLEGCHDKAVAIDDRAKAINYAIEQLQEGDILLVAGKGHEKTQLINGVHHEFDDVKIVEQSIRLAKV